jgi:hypothetical protein
VNPKTVTIPLSGGPGDGQTVRAVLDRNGRPPLRHDLVTDGGLDAAATYELGMADTGWIYRYRSPDGGDQPDADFATEHDSATFAEEMDGGPEGHPEDDSPRGYAGAD